MTFALTILGSNSAMPAFGRFTTSQLLQIADAYYLIDAGEGVQMQLAKYRLKKNRIKCIFISHLHGDHIIGLLGLVVSFSQSQRKEKLVIFGPEGVEKFVQSFLEVSESYISYPLEYKIVNNKNLQKIYVDNSCEVYAFPVDHRIPCWGYLFKEKVSAHRIKPEMIKKYKLNIEQIKEAKKGNTVRITNGNLLDTEMLCFPLKKQRSYAYCADTAYTESFLEYISGVSLLYHETTYLDELKEKAVERKHSTTKDAARIAKKANVEKLIIGHYSSRYKYLEPLLKEAKEIFENTILAIDGELIEIKREKD